MKLTERADKLIPEMREKLKNLSFSDMLSVQMSVVIYKALATEMAEELDWASIGVGLLTYGAVNPGNEAAGVIGSVLVAFSDNVEGFDDIVKGWDSDGTEPSSDTD